jgi:hypothetical protein
METEQRRIVELQEKKLNYLKKYSNNLIQSIIKSKMLEMIQYNTSICTKKSEKNTNTNCFINCINKRYEVSELLIEVKKFNLALIN